MEKTRALHRRQPDGQRGLLLDAVTALGLLHLLLPLPPSSRHDDDVDVHGGGSAVVSLGAITTTSTTTSRGETL